MSDDNQLKQQLIQQMGSRDNDEALSAVEQLRKRGWLTDGSLQGANLSGSNLRGADLHGADLHQVNLGEAYLADANLSQASLFRANLSAASLSLANLRAANLRLADLKRANLAGTDFIRANLSGANFSQTVCGHTTFTNVDLSDVKGLEEVVHDGPSSIGIDTLYKSKGKIPEVFLRGCGVPEVLITYLPSLMENAFDFYSCFISHSHADKDFADRLYEKLQGEGIRCWLDEKELLPGEDIYEGIQHGIKVWDKMILICSQSALSEKWWVDHEIDLAFQKERDIMQSLGEKVGILIPLDLDGYLFDDAYTSGKSQQIRSRVAGNFQNWKNHDAFEQEAQKVIKALRTDGGKPPDPESKIGKSKP